MQTMEHLLNVYASTSSCRRAVAPFRGYLEMEEPRGKLTRGLWLLWDYEGDRTLSYYLRRRDCLKVLAKDLDVPEEIVIPTVMRQIFENLADLHNCGIVHRDIKPANIVLSEKERRFKLIDLGAAADLRTGTNYSPDSTILDPLYCPPEEYVLPTDAPHLAETAAPLAMAISPYLWQQHRPDCFDTFSAGVILLQLSLPFMRSQSTLKNWRGTFARCGYDLDEWRSMASLSPKQTVILDENDGAGWDLAAGLLRPRKVELDGDGIVRFVNTGRAPRLTAQGALKHAFLKNAISSRLNSSPTGMISIGSFFGSLSTTSSMETVDDIDSKEPVEAKNSWLETEKPIKRKSTSAEIKPKTVENKQKSKNKTSWNWFKDKLFDLEARLMNDISATQTQTTIVEQLKKDVKAGKASKTDLEIEEDALKSMSKSLKRSANDLADAYKSATGFLSSALRKSQQQNIDADPYDVESNILGSEAKQASGRMKQSSKEGSSKQIRKESEEIDEKGRDNISETVAGAATNAIYSGLKLTGMALNAVADFAAAAERGMARAKEEAEAQREATGMFITFLQEFDPPLGPDSTWKDVESAVSDVKGVDVLSERQKLLAFETYIKALRAKSQENSDALDKETELRRGSSNDGSHAIGLEQNGEIPGSIESNHGTKPSQDSNIALSTLKTEDEKVNEYEKISEEKLKQIEKVLEEQARLKMEYEQMERQMMQMKKALEMSGLAKSIFAGEMEVVPDDNDGSVTFKFAPEDKKASDQ